VPLKKNQMKIVGWNSRQATDKPKHPPQQEVNSQDIFRNIMARKTDKGFMQGTAKQWLADEWLFNCRRSIGIGWIAWRMFLTWVM
jgi:hypothetical protein